MIASHQCAGSKETVGIIPLLFLITYSWRENFKQLDFKQFGRGTTTQMEIGRLAHRFQFDPCIDYTCASSVAQSCPTLHDPMGHSPPNCSVHGISQARIPVCLPFPTPGDLLDPGIEAGSPPLAGRFLR